MKPERFDRWLTIGANLAVLLGLLFVAVELRQNRTMIDAQTRHELSAGIVELLSAVAENSQLASVIRRADLGEALTLDEEYQYEVRSRALFRYWENVHYQYRQGVYDDAEFFRQREAWEAYLTSSPALANYWRKIRAEFSRPFVSEMDSLLPGAKGV